MTDEQLESLIGSLEFQPESLLNAIGILRSSLASRRSKAFIAAHNIHRTEIETPDPGTCIDTIIGHLKVSPPTKRFYNWNGMLHWSSVLKEGKFNPTPARFDDVPE